MAGSRVIGQEADFIIGMNKIKDSGSYIKEIDFRYKQADEKVSILVIKANLWLKKVDEVNEDDLLAGSDGRRFSKNKDSILSFFKSQNGINDGNVSIKLLKEKFNEQFSIQTIHSHLKKLAEVNKIVKISHGVYKLAS